MKRNRILSITPLALGFALGTLQFTPVLSAQSRTAPQQQAAPQQQQDDQQKPKVFVGKVVKTKDGQFALLTDEQAGKGVYLDDQEKAKSFEGKNVKVTGTLDMAKNLVHVSDIQLV